MLHRKANLKPPAGLLLLSILFSGCGRESAPLAPIAERPAPRFLVELAFEPTGAASEATLEPIATARPLDMDAQQTSGMTTAPPSYFKPSYFKASGTSPLVGVRPIRDDSRSAAPAHVSPPPIAPEPAVEIWSAPQLPASPVESAISPDPIPSQTVNYNYATPQRAPSAVASQRSAYMAAIVQQAEMHNRQGFELANRGACFSARAEFIQALRLVAQGLDAENQTSQHGQALAAAMRALEEAEDFAPRGSRLEADVDLATLVGAHRTPVLKGLPLAGASPVVASQRYYAFAEEQFAAAVGAEQAGSLALQSLGKIHGIVANQKAPAIFEAEAKAAAYYQSALLADPGNYLAANDLAVLLAKGGSYGEARELLLRAVAVAPAASVWHNLSIVHAHLGETDLAQRAHQKAVASSGGANPGNPQAMMAMQAVRWVDPATFAASSTPSSDLQPPAANQAPAPAVNQPPAQQTRTGMGRWLQRSTR